MGDHAPHDELAADTPFHREYLHRQSSGHELRWRTHGAESQDCSSVVCRVVDAVNIFCFVNYAQWSANKSTF